MAEFLPHKIYYLYVSNKLRPWSCPAFHSYGYRAEQMGDGGTLLPAQHNFFLTTCGSLWRILLLCYSEFFFLPLYQGCQTHLVHEMDEWCGANPQSGADPQTPGHIPDPVHVAPGLVQDAGLSRFHGKHSLGKPI